MPVKTDGRTTAEKLHAKALCKGSAICTDSSSQHSFALPFAFRCPQPKYKETTPRYSPASPSGAVPFRASSPYRSRWHILPTPPVSLKNPIQLAQLVFQPTHECGLQLHQPGCSSCAQK